MCSSCCWMLQGQDAWLSQAEYVLLFVQQSAAVTRYVFLNRPQGGLPVGGWTEFLLHCGLQHMTASGHLSKAFRIHVICGVQLCQSFQHEPMSQMHRWGSAETYGAPVHVDRLSLAAAVRTAMCGITTSSFPPPWELTWCMHVCGSTKPCRKTIFMAWWHFHLQQPISAQVVL